MSGPRLPDTVSFSHLGGLKLFNDLCSRVVLSHRSYSRGQPGPRSYSGFSGVAVLGRTQEDTVGSDTLVRVRSGKALPSLCGAFRAEGKRTFGVGSPASLILNQ